jgi:hypothetical protein
MRKEVAWNLDINTGAGDSAAATPTKKATPSSRKRKAKEGSEDEDDENFDHKTPTKKAKAAPRKKGGKGAKGGDDSEMTFKNEEMSSRSTIISLSHNLDTYFPYDQAHQTNILLPDDVVDNLANVSNGYMNGSNINYDEDGSYYDAEEA